MWTAKSAGRGKDDNSFQEDDLPGEAMKWSRGGAFLVLLVLSATRWNDTIKSSGKSSITWTYGLRLLRTRDKPLDRPRRSNHATSMPFPPA